MPDERQQFRILFRNFLSRVVDLELLSPGGDMQTLLIQFAAILAAFNFVLLYLLAPRYFTSTLPRATLQVNAWRDEEFLISTTISVVALLLVLAWDNLLPDLRDSFVLGVLPVRKRTVALAKISAIACATGTTVLLLNLFTGFSYAAIAAADDGILALLRTFASYWTTMFVAALFTLSALVSVQGVAALLLGHRVFMRVSGFLQCFAFFAILAVYFLKPQLATEAALGAPQNQAWLRLLPSYWFLGFFHMLNGTTRSAFAPLTQRAVLATVITATVATMVLALAYTKNVRRILEQPDISPADRLRHASRLPAALAEFIFHRGLDRAIVLFSFRTLARSRKHRLLLALYAGIGFALALAYTESLLHGDWGQKWNQPNAPLLVASLVMVFLFILGTRIVFTFPYALSSNWIFRVTAVQNPAAYFSAVRTSLYGLAAFPIWIALAGSFLAIWPGRPVLVHLLLLGIIIVIIVEKSLYGFRKIPFACSYLPGKANLKVTLGLYAAVILFAAHQGGLLEFWAMNRAARYCTLFAILVIWAVRSRYRFREFATAALTPIQFEDRPAGVFAIDLRQDGDLLGGEIYVESGERRSFRQRLFIFSTIVFVFLLVGTIYEQYGEWQDRKMAPQIGRSIDIGRRSLNLYCLGNGSPTVIFESNWGLPGYSWLPIQREVAKFTRACWYDRAGYGWSDPGPFPNHSDSIARDLHRLLTAEHVPPPYVLAAHAIGSFHARVFRGFYPQEVAGLVLIDPTSEDLTVNIHNHIEFFRPAVLLLHQFMGVEGFFRLMKGEPVHPTGGFTQEEWNRLDMLRWQTKSLVAEGKEPPLWICGEQARAAGRFGDIPVVVLSAGIQDWEEDPKLNQDHARKLILQSNLAALSSNGVQRTVTNSGHWIVFDAPEAVVTAVHEVVDNVRDPREQGSDLQAGSHVPGSTHGLPPRN